jgi:hypothetical protein
MRRFTTLIFSVFYLCSVTSVFLPRLAHASGQLQKQTLRGSGQMLHVVSKDMDGDGTAELVTSSRRGKPGQIVRTMHFWRATAKGFQTKPTQSLDFGEQVVGFDVCDVTPHPGREIVLLSNQDIRVLHRPLTGSATDNYITKPLHLSPIKPALAVPDPADVPPMRLCENPKGGAPELWIPMVLGTEIYRITESGIESQGILRVTPTSTHWIPDQFRGPRLRRDYSVLTQLAFPVFQSLDADNDGDDDCFAMIEDRIWLFERQNGLLNTSAVSFRDFNLRTSDEWREDKNRLQIHLADMTGDGLPDAVTVKNSGRIQKMQTETRVYKGQGRKGFASAPLDIRKVDGYGTPEGVFDVNGDGKVEILEPVMELNPMAIARFLLTRSIEMQFRSLRIVNGKFSLGEPLGINFKVDPGGTGVKGALPLLGQDISGDGISDRVDLGEGEEVLVFLGKAGDPVFKEEPYFTAKVASTQRGDWFVPSPGKPASIVIFYPKDTQTGSTLHVFWNPLGAL